MICKYVNVDVYANVYANVHVYVKIFVFVDICVNMYICKVNMHIFLHLSFEKSRFNMIINS